MDVSRILNWLTETATISENDAVRERYGVKLPYSSTRVALIAEALKATKVVNLQEDYMFPEDAALPVPEAVKAKR